MALKIHINIEDESWYQDSKECSQCFLLIVHSLFVAVSPTPVQPSVRETDFTSEPVSPISVEWENEHVCSISNTTVVWPKKVKQLQICEL